MNSRGTWAGDPGFVAAEFGGEEAGNWLGHPDSGFGVEKKRPGVAGEHIFQRAGHLLADGPDDFGGDVRQVGIEPRGERWGRAARRGLLRIGAVDGEVRKIARVSSSRGY